jgi:hypothetical protein
MALVGVTDISGFSSGFFWALHSRGFSLIVGGDFWVTTFAIGRRTLY